MKEGKNMKEVILEKLKEIEKKENVKIIMAIESGSRAWGFASPDSDYDVRFIYIRKIENYLKLEKTRDVIEWQLDETLDINGWDLQKMLRLLYKSNPTIFEWTNSPIVYKKTAEWDSLKTIINSCFVTKPGLYHYFNMAKGNYREYLKGETVKLKKYFYVLRPILACKWIIERKCPPPMEFQALVEYEMDDDFKPVIAQLLDEKINSPETEFIVKIDIINKYIEKQIDFLSCCIPRLKQDKENSYEGLNQKFLEILFENNKISYC